MKKIVISGLLILIQFCCSAQLKINLDSIKSNSIEYDDSVTDSILGSKYPYSDITEFIPYLTFYSPKRFISKYKYNNELIQGQVIGKSKKNLKDWEGTSYTEKIYRNANYKDGILSGPFLQKVDKKYKDKSKNKTTETNGIFINGFFKGTVKEWVNKILVSEVNLNVCFQNYMDKRWDLIDDETGETIRDDDGEIISILFVEDFKKSDYHGIQKKYFNNGTLKSIEFYFNGENIGPNVYYLENGDIKEYTINLYAHLIKNGLKKIGINLENHDTLTTVLNNKIIFNPPEDYDYYDGYKTIGKEQISSLKNLYANSNVGDTVFEMHLKKYGYDFKKDSVSYWDDTIERRKVEKVTQSVFFENGKIEKIIDYDNRYNYETQNYCDFETVTSFNNNNIIAKVFLIKEDSSKFLMEEKIYFSGNEEKENSSYDGIKTLYYQSGNSKKIKAKGYFNKDQRVGEWSYFYENGKLKERGIVPNYFEIGIDCYDIFKELGFNRFFNTCSNDYNGFWEYYDKNGVLEKREVYKNGILVE